MSNSPPSSPRTDFLWKSLIVLAATLSASCGQGTQTGTAGQTSQVATSSPSPIPWATIEPPTQAAAPAGTPQPGNATASSQFVFPKNMSPADVKTFNGVGVVRLINFEEGWIEIDHEEIKGFMPAMHMEWAVRDRTLLKSVQVGDKVNFTVLDYKGTEYITKLKKASPPQ